MGAFEDYFSEDTDTTAKAKKKHPVDPSETPMGKRATKLMSKVRDSAHERALNKNPSITEELSTLQDSVEFAISSTLMLDVLGAFEIEFDEYPKVRSQAAMVLIVAYLREYLERKGAQDEE